MKPTTPQNDELHGLLAALTDGEIGVAEFARLQRLLLENPDAQAYYRRYMRLCSLLEFELAGTKDEAGKWEEKIGRQGDKETRRLVDSGSSVSPSPPLPLSPSSIPPSTFPLSPSYSPHSSFSSLLSLDTPLGSFLFSYGVSAVLVGILILAFSMMSAGHPEAKNIALDSPSSSGGAKPERKRKPEPKIVMVGQITGMVDCTFSDDRFAPAHNGVALGAKYTLDSGLMEITYKTGARVLLQGPCTYTAESVAGGFLSLGKLTARVESRSRLPSETSRSRLLDGTSSELGASESRPAGGTYFAVRTPTAVVTDLGTEFGVEVNDSGATKTQVFVGAVRLVAGKADSPEEGKVLQAGQAARIERGNPAIIVTSIAETDRKRFVRDVDYYVASRVISVNITQKGKAGLEPAEKTGVVSAPNWNNIIGTRNPAPVVSLRNGVGEPTNAKITWQWFKPNKLMTFSHIDDPRGSREKMLDVCFVTDTDTNKWVSLTIKVSEVPYATYRAYVYFWQTPVAGPENLYTFGLSVNGGPKMIWGRPQYDLNDFYRYRDMQFSGNYQVFDGLSGDLTIAVTPDGPGPHHSPMITGLQIIGTNDKSNDSKPKKGGATTSMHVDVKNREAGK